MYLPFLLLGLTTSDRILYREIDRLIQAQLKNKKLLVLDLDDTLLHCRQEPFSTSSVYTKIHTATQDVDGFISPRPGLVEFLTAMKTRYTLILFTTGIKEYAHTLLKALDIQSFFSLVLHREFCKQNENNKLIKDMSIFGVPLNDVILLDDSPVHLPIQPDNMLQIKAYRGESEDRELSRITGYLLDCASKEDVRPVLKNFENWSGSAVKTPITYIAQSTRRIETKFMQNLKFTHKKSNSMNPRFEEEFKDIEEDVIDSDLEQKVSQIKLQKEPALGNLKLISGYKPKSAELPARVIGQRRDSETSESSERTSSLGLYSRDSQPFNLRGSSETINLTQKMPLLVIKSQFSRLKDIPGKKDPTSPMNDPTSPMNDLPLYRSP